MKEGDVILLALPQADDKFKNRPALLLRRLPPFGDWLVCGISSQLHLAASDFDEIITSAEDDYAASGLVTDSVVRLGFLAVVPGRDLLGSIGTVAPERHRRLLNRLSEFLRR